MPRWLAVMAALAAILSVLVAAIALVGTFVVPEVRKLLGLGEPPSTTTTPTGERAPTPSAVRRASAPAPTPTVSRSSTYVNRAAVEAAGPNSTGLVVISAADPTHHDQLSAMLTQRGRQVVMLFRPAFVSEGRADKLMDGDWGVLADVDLMGRVQTLVLSRSQVEYSPSPIVQNMWNVSLSVRLVCLRVGIQGDCGSQTFVVRGTGFSQEQALRSASESASASARDAVRAMTF